MQKRKTYIFKISLKAGALLLMMMFLAIPLIQALHLHHDSFLNKIEKTTVSSAEKCLVCEYSNQIKGKQILMAHIPVIDIPNRVYTLLNTFVFTRIYHYTLPTFGNKGPPCFV